MFNCKRCQEKGLHIASLKSQITFLQSMLQPKSDTRPDLVMLEANKVMEGGSGYTVEIDDPNPGLLAKLSEEEKERMQILSGNY